MKTTRSLMLFCLIEAVLLASSAVVQAQGFVNFDFEDAQIVPIAGSPYYPYGITTSNALPGWTVYYGSSQQSEITYNSPALGSTWVNLWAANGQQIDGNFSVLLQGGGTATAASISQIALVPASAESLLFKAQAGPGAAAGSLIVSIGGQDILLFAFAKGPNYTSYGGNIPSILSGQEEQLTISALEGGGNNWNIDDIQFSSSPIPEPGTLGLFALGSLFFAGRCVIKSLLDKP